MANMKITSMVDAKPNRREEMNQARLRPVIDKPAMVRWLIMWCVYPKPPRRTRFWALVLQHAYV